MIFPCECRDIINSARVQKRERIYTFLVYNLFSKVSESHCKCQQWYPSTSMHKEPNTIFQAKRDMMSSLLVKLRFSFCLSTFDMFQLESYLVRLVHDMPKTSTKSTELAFNMINAVFHVRCVFDLTGTFSFLSGERIKGFVQKCSWVIRDMEVDDSLQVFILDHFLQKIVNFRFHTHWRAQKQPQD